MDKKTLKALNGSIKKWEAIIKGTGVDDGTDNCPLCQIFFDKWTKCASACKGCPVMKKTGKQYCEGSPYEAWAELGVDRIEEPLRELAQASAKAELKFLKSLRPKKRKTR